MVRIGLEGDKRKFQRKIPPGSVTSKIQDVKVKWPKCECCKMDIKGKAFPGSRSGLFNCNQCWNEKVV